MPSKPKKPKQPISTSQAKRIPRKLSARVRWPKRARIIERYMQSVFNKLAREGKLSSVHHIGHAQRVAFYAMKYAEILGASPALQIQAKIAGLTHDRIRYPAQKISHAEASAKFMESLFAKRYGKEATKRITTAIAQHGSLPPLSKIGRNLIRDAVVFADKFFEANGAYIAFRRAMHMGERKDMRKEAKRLNLDLTKPKDIEEAAIRFTLDETKKRIAKFSDLSKIPEFLHPFVKYQIGWQIKLKEGLERRDPEIVHLVTYLFKEGLEKRPRLLDEVIRAYEPKGKKDAGFKREALRYLRGDLCEEFVKKTIQLNR